MLSYQHRKSHCGDKTVVRSSYLHNGISYTSKMTYLYWIRAQVYYGMMSHSMTWRSVWYIDQTMNSKRTFHILPLWVNYGILFMSMSALEKNGMIKKFDCIYAEHPVPQLMPFYLSALIQSWSPCYALKPLWALYLPPAWGGMLVRFTYTVEPHFNRVCYDTI